jgi:hypothetical protein
MPLRDLSTIQHVIAPLPKMSIASLRDTRQCPKGLTKDQIAGSLLLDDIPQILENVPIRGRCQGSVTAPAAAKPPLTPPEAPLCSADLGNVRI